MRSTLSPTLSLWSILIAAASTQGAPILSAEPAPGGLSQTHPAGRDYQAYPPHFKRHLEGSKLAILEPLNKRYGGRPAWEYSSEDSSKQIDGGDKKLQPLVEEKGSDAASGNKRYTGHPAWEYSSKDFSKQGDGGDKKLQPLENAGVEEKESDAANGRQTKPWEELGLDEQVYKQAEALQRLQDDKKEKGESMSRGRPLRYEEDNRSNRYSGARSPESGSVHAMGYDRPVDPPKEKDGGIPSHMRSGSRGRPDRYERVDEDFLRSFEENNAANRPQNGHVMEKGIPSHIPPGGSTSRGRPDRFEKVDEDFLRSFAKNNAANRPQNSHVMEKGIPSHIPPGGSTSRGRPDRFEKVDEAVSRWLEEHGTADQPRNGYVIEKGIPSHIPPGGSTSRGRPDRFEKVDEAVSRWLEEHGTADQPRNGHVMEKGVPSIPPGGSTSRGRLDRYEGWDEAWLEENNVANRLQNGHVMKKGIPGQMLSGGSMSRGKPDRYEGWDEAWLEENNAANRLQNGHVMEKGKSAKKPQKPKQLDEDNQTIGLTKEPVEKFIDLTKEPDEKFIDLTMDINDID